MTDTQTERVEDMGFDRVLQRLRTVVHRLETGNLGLEESLRVYEEGVSPARRGYTLLDHAEKRVELLVRDGREGLSSVPFGVAGDSASDAGAEGEADIESSG